MSEPEFEFDYGTATVEQMWERFQGTVLAGEKIQNPELRREMVDAFKAMYMAGFMDCYRSMRATFTPAGMRGKALYQEAQDLGCKVASARAEREPPQESA